MAKTNTNASNTLWETTARSFLPIQSPSKITGAKIRFIFKELALIIPNPALKGNLMRLIMQNSHAVVPTKAIFLNPCATR